jgi:hypothetical protein
MKKLSLLIILSAAALLCANPQYYPMTSIAESCVTQGNAYCDYALDELGDVVGQTTRSEFITARLYHDSGDLSSTSVEDRLLAINATTMPTMIFNGSVTVTGAAMASTYSDVLDGFLYHASPLRMEISSFNPATGAVTVSITKLDPDQEIINQDLVFFLVEDSVGAYTNVTRQVISQVISIPEIDTAVSFNATFTVDAGWNQDHLWALAFVENDSYEILQSASTLPFPTYNMRCAYDWDGSTLVSDPNSNFNSEPLWLFNTGSSDNMTMKIVVDSAPTDWYFNYCDEGGNCYPGSVPMPLTMGAGDTAAYHLNLSVGSTGIAYFHYEINSSNLGTFNVPFVLRTSDYVANDDPIAQPVLTLGQNSPNPFHGTTTFNLTADKSGQASIQIFNLKGQLVAETGGQQLQQGSNSITWQAPQGLPSGVYYYRVKGVSGPLHRMLLLK